MALTEIPIELSSTPSIVDGGNATAITIDSSEKVGIGTASPTAPLNSVSAYSSGAITTSLKLATVGGYNSNSGTSLDFGQDQGTYPTWLTGRIASPRTGNNWGGSLTFSTNDNSAETAVVERMRIDASGNLLVGKTSTAFGTAGAALYASGDNDFVNDGNVMSLNRLNSDGSIITLYKDSTAVGVIGSQTLAGSSELFIGNGGNIGLGFEQTGVDKIFPCNGSTGAARDAAIDLGDYSERFGNGYFSGDVNATNFTGIGDGDTFINMPGSNVMRLLTGNAERMYIAANGNITTNSYSYNNVDGHKFSTSGTFQIGMNYNSLGAEIILVNNRTSGAQVSLIQYRTAGTVEGSLIGNSSGLTISNVSDHRVKENIADLTGSLDIINALQPRTYTYKAGLGKSTETQVGFIAHEFAEHIPNAVTGAKDAVYTQADIDEGTAEVAVGSDKLQTLSYSNDEVITRLVGAIQEQQATITALTARIETLENN